MRKELAPKWALLGLLTQKPMHGYELRQYFTDPSALGQVWYLGLSQMYKLLKELGQQGLPARGKPCADGEFTACLV